MGNSPSIYCSILLSLLYLLLSQQPFRLKGFASKASMPSFAFSWHDDKAAFRAGDTATIKIKVLELPSGEEEGYNASRRSLFFAVSVNGKRGNSSYITDVGVHIDGETTSWNISFVPMRAGDFAVLVSEEHFGINFSALQFTVTAGQMHPSASMVSWMDYSASTAGTKAFLSVLPKDAFGNVIPRGTNMPSNEYFKVSGTYQNGSILELMDFRYNGWAEAGFLGLEFVPTIAGDFLVHVFGDNKTLRDSPLPLTVKPGTIDIAKSIGVWKHGTSILQIFSKLEIFIQQKDSYGNIVPEIHPFDASVVERASNLSVPVIDLLIEVVADGIQLLSFTVVEPGEFLVTIFDTQMNKRISNMVYMFDVFVGYCDGLNSFANGSGLVHSVAGTMSSFMVFLEDQYHNPSPIESTMLQVQILNKNGTSYANPIISPLREPNEVMSVDRQNSFAQGPAYHQKIITGNSTVQASSFNVSYTHQMAGEYEIWMLCGNIALSNGRPYAMTVSPGTINTSLSGVLMFDPRVKRSVENEVTVQLVDSFMNTVVSLESKLSFQLRSANITTPVNMKSFLAGEFVDKKDGSYTSHYVAKHLGSYNICIQFGGEQLAPCPFEVHVLEDEYFSEVQNDSISVWEDESVSFDVLSNDYIAGGQADVVNASSPLHGSVQQYNQIYRYTPFEGFFGNDSFSYTISDKHNNVVTGMVFISVLCRPPQFVSLPHHLHVTEDLLGPKFGGFPGIELVYSDATENISVTVKAQFGNVFLAPMPMQLQQTSDDVLSIGRGGRASKDLILQGTVGTINDALQSLQYIGNEDFYGNDIIMLYAMNKNGIEEAQLPIFVEPINDPPVVLAPKSIFLGGKESREGFQIFDRQRDRFEFSIVEPDFLSFPGNQSHLLLVLSLEVFEGTLTMTMPAGIIATAELKTEGSNHWQSLQSYVTIANHFVLRGTGIRFRGTVLDCNNAMQQLFYQGTRHETILSISVNDLANYGCYPDCSEMTSVPLSTETTVHLIKRKPTDSRRALLVGSLIAIEILTMLGLGGVLLYFLLKCVKALKGEQRDCIDSEMHTPEQIPSDQHMDASPSQEVGYGSSPTALPSLGGNGSNFRQRSSRSCKQELELEPVPGIRIGGNQNDRLAIDEGK